MKFSKFGEKIAHRSGIKSLMDDLGHAMSVNRDMSMLGGGNPAHIPEVQALFKREMFHILERGSTFEECIGNYDSPRGNHDFIMALVDLFNDLYGWGITPDNIALTNGSQSAFFTLFNLFGGSFDNGLHKKILLPLAPEYIGYGDVGISRRELFVSVKPEIEFLEDRLFKYHVDFKNISLDEKIGAVCVSRPTNPTGNVLSDEEVQKLVHITERASLPLIVDNAYGVPFPDIIFRDVKLSMAPNVITCFSLSKVGLPGVRTGIIIGSEEVIDRICRVNAVMNLAPGSVGAVLATGLVNSRELISMSGEIIRPYYKNKMEFALGLLREKLAGIDFHIHKPEGAIFLWIWFRGMKISSHELYERLKERGVLIVSGHYFFPGLAENWKHSHECIRLTYSQSNETLERGIEIIADEVRKHY